MNDNTARHRSRDDYDRGLEPARPANDPLAELARLIGQNDPFAHGRQNTHTAAPRDARNDDSPFADWEADDSREPATPYPATTYNVQDDVPYDAHTPSHSIAPEAHYEDHEHVAEPQGERVDVDHVPPSEPVTDHVAADVDRDEIVTAYDAPPTAETDLEPEPVLLADEFYDDAPQRSGFGVLTMVLGAVGLAAIGVGGAFAYRTYVSNPSLPAVPPVIRASSEPAKVVPPAPKNDTANKLSYDRFGDRSQNEKMVVREEKPVDPKNLVTSSPAAPPASSVFPPVAPPAPAAAAAPQAPANPPSVLTEPKRVRTVPVLPEQTNTAVLPQMAAPAPAVTPAPQPAPTATAPTNVAPTATARPPAQTAAPARTAHTPLSLAPGATKAPAPSRAVRTAAPMPLASATAPATRTGGYLVQVASQRSQADAQSSYRSIRSKYSGVLGNREAVIRKADLGSKGVYYRAMVGPFPTRDQAVQLCASLKAAGGTCVVQSN